MSKTVVVIGILLIALQPYQPCWAQSANISRLRSKILARQQHPGYLKDTAYVELLDSLAFSYFRISVDSLIFYSDKALELATQIGYARGQSISLRHKGNAYFELGDYSKMLLYYQDALRVAEKENDSLLMAKAMYNIGNNAYHVIGRNEDARNIIKKASDIFQIRKDSLAWYMAITVIGSLWANDKKYEEALSCFNRALQVATALKDRYAIVIVNDQIGKLYQAEGRFKEALASLLQAWDYFSNTDDMTRQSQCASEVADVYIQLKNYPMALKYASISLQKAQAVKSKPHILNAVNELAATYEALGDTRYALKYFKLLKQASDSVANETMRKKTEQLEARYEFEKKEALLNAAQEKKDALNKSIVQKKELQIFIALLLILLLSLLVLLLIRSRAIKQKNNLILETKNEEIERQALLLLKNNQEKDNMFSIISHDLKVPLHSLKVILQLLGENYQEKENIEKILEELRRDVNYSSDLVNNLLFWASSQFRGSSVMPVIFSVHQVITDALQIFIKQAEAKGIKLKHELTAEEITVWADMNMIQVIIRNLVSNAIKFCNTGNTITVSVSTSNAVVTISVADNGIGIPPETLEKLNQGQMVSTFGTADEKGIGLGLRLCYELAKLNNGLLTVESKPGEGSIFYLALPCKPL
ncbi:tetratricopeptide repeat protein [Flavitalea sp. BT771]|uniref:tetratricopeptide repeat protein n=1 Tax=Flavitalea sp. BT771 TaxID=3063329 RepID=UPI0026E268C4|nr:tetratricopeptide repeat protein [Flavitalea sp. BT771]MDO6435610.1 tetratricopeptide repeat protein [Flavitalea sp. BT771]MDV6224510.1 tetratricopeptide repeat protein [Flavitalea sp. BT771]